MPMVTWGALLAVALTLLVGCTRTVPQGPTDEVSLRPAKIEYEDISGGYTDYGKEDPSEYPGWQRFDDWHVKLLSDDMDPTSHVRLFSRFKYMPDPGQFVVPGWDRSSFGFEIFGGRLVIVSPNLAAGARASWPHCDYDGASISVDGQKPVYIADVRFPGSCNSVEVDGRVIKAMQEGREAKIKIHGVVGTVSLFGFKQAWEKALSSGNQ